MTENSYKYDVAFSFLAIDEPIAAQLHDKLKSRLSSFYYAEPERQQLIGGRDGDEAYGRVFGEEARIVVVLYRGGWGDKGFTQIEATAIRNRGYEQGHEFLTFINRDQTPLPRWLPRSRVWIGLERYGLDHAATVIESRVQEAGGASHEETAIARAERMQAEMAAEGARRSFLRSQEGAKAALDGLQRIFEQVKAIGAGSQGQIGEPKRVPAPSFTFHLPSNCDEWKIGVAWNLGASYTTEKAELVVREWRGSILDLANGRPGLPGPKKSTSFVFDYRNDVPGWREKGNESRSYRHEELADWIANRLLARIEERRNSEDD